MSDKKKEPHVNFFAPMDRRDFLKCSAFSWGVLWPCPRVWGGSWKQNAKGGLPFNVGDALIQHLPRTKFIPTVNNAIPTAASK